MFFRFLSTKRWQFTRKWLSSRKLMPNEELSSPKWKHSRNKKTLWLRTWQLLKTSKCHLFHNMKRRWGMWRRSTLHWKQPINGLQFKLTGFRKSSKKPSRRPKSKWISPRYTEGKLISNASKTYAYVVLALQGRQDRLQSANECELTEQRLLGNLVLNFEPCGLGITASRRKQRAG